MKKTIQALFGFTKKDNNILQIGNRIYYLTPNHKTDRPIIAAVSGSKCTLVIDGGNSAQHASKFLSQIGEYVHSPLEYLVLTHGHWDHVFGMDRMNLITIAHEKTICKIAEYKALDWHDTALDERVSLGLEIPFVSEKLKLEIAEEDRNAISFKIPEISFSDRYYFDLGSITCEVCHVGGDHAEDSCIVYVPEEKVVFLGDCLFVDIYKKQWCYTIENILALANKLLSFDANIYVASHSGQILRNQLEIFFEQLLLIGKLVRQYSNDYKRVIEELKIITGKQPSKDIKNSIQYFINGTQNSELNQGNMW